MRKKPGSYILSYSFLLPFFFFFVVFIIYPIIDVFILSFQSGTFLDQRFIWAGLRNFRTVLTNKDFINSFRNSLLYIVMAVPVCQIFALFFAILIRKKTAVTTIYESVFFMPMLISMVAASVLIAYVLSNNGPVNAVIEFAGLEKVNWMGKPFNALVSVMILEIWKGGTFFIFVYMTALRAIPEDYSQAARIDGANNIQETFMITLPLLRHSIILCITMNTIWQFQIFESVYMLTGGGPLKATESVIYSLYMYTFKFGRIGVGAAASVLFLFFILIVCGLEMLVFRLGGDGRDGGL
ncbi:MAG: sugar ABC transporter permease [Treponema sp.]|nr:sugar ABC transporter permease [Treponema sp.]